MTRGPSAVSPSLLYTVTTPPQGALQAWSPRPPSALCSGTPACYPGVDLPALHQLGAPEVSAQGWPVGGSPAQHSGGCASAARMEREGSRALEGRGLGRVPGRIWFIPLLVCFLSPRALQLRGLSQEPRARSPELHPGLPCGWEQERGLTEQGQLGRGGRSGSLRGWCPPVGWLVPA